jgi:succinate dehydrogenase / fumarate reductase flavoprotein subunit
MGEASFAYHGANRLGANSLLSCIFDGLFGGSCIKNYVTDLAKDGAPESEFNAIVAQESDRQKWLISNNGTENPYLLWQEMGREMTANCTVVRRNEDLKKTIDRCQDWKERYKRIKLSDTGMWSNQNLSFARATRDMILLAEAILKGALQRDESRGAHYKPEFPNRDDANFLKATIATYDAKSNAAEIGYGPVDVSLVTPRARTYGKTDAPKVATDAVSKPITDPVSPAPGMTKTNV